MGEQLLWAVVKFAAVLGFMSFNAIFLVWLERKVAGFIQYRYGPMVTGKPHGWLQTIADAIKLLSKEDIIPALADRKIFILAPLVMIVPTFLLHVVIPFGPNLIVKDLETGVLFFFAVSGFTTLAIVMAGWASNNKYSLLGAIRAIAQLIGYELPLIISVVAIVLLSGSMSTQEIVRSQATWPYIILQPIGFLVFFIAALAELGRVPFDLLEAESELVAGYNTEYSGMRWAFFFLAEYGNLAVMSAMVATLFLGGWQGPILPPMIWFLLKTYLVAFVIIWIRWTFPRVRPDQLSKLGWKYLLPASLVNLALTSLYVVII